MDVTCQIASVEIENDQQRMIDGVSATCPRCNHTTESMGVTERSIRRVLALMRNECPNREKNHYTCAELAGEAKPWDKPQPQQVQTVEVFVPPVPSKQGRQPITRVVYDYSYLWRQSNNGEVGAAAWTRMFGTPCPPRDKAVQVITRGPEEELWFFLQNQLVAYIVHPDGDAIASVVCHMLAV